MTGPSSPAGSHWSARPWFAPVAGIALVAPWVVLVPAPALSPVIVFGGVVVAGLAAGYLADRATIPGLLAGVGYALPALAVVVLDPCKGAEAWSETAGGAVLLLALGSITATLGSRLGARLAARPSTSAGPVPVAIVLVAALVAGGVLVLAGRAAIAGCPAL